MQSLKGRAGGLPVSLRNVVASQRSSSWPWQTARGLAQTQKQTGADPGLGKSKGSQDLPKEAEVVVIGGGAVGSSTLYHLAKMGIKDAILIEKHEATSGTTWHSAGLLWRLRPTDVDTLLIDHTHELATKVLEEETGLSSGWAPNGGLFPASTPQRLDEFKRFATLGRHYGIESRLLSPSESKDIHPFLNPDGILASLYSPGDGTIEPAGIVAAYIKGAKKYGAKVYENTSVKGFEIKDGQVIGVKTNRGDIKTKKVVNCCGVWGKKLGHMAGVKVPLVSMKHAYVVTEPIEGIHGVPNMRDHEASVYIKRQGESFQVGGYEMNPIFWDDPQDDFAFSLFDLDWEVFEAHIKGSVHRVPVIGETGIKSTVCGPESFTPDHKPLLGEAPELKGFYLGCGFNSAGIMLSGGCGRELANMVMERPTSVDMFSYDIRRFHPSLCDNEQWLNQRSHEAYAKNYSILYPYDQPLAGRNIRKSPFHDRLVKAGCVYGEAHGWERPTWFAGSKRAAESQVLAYDYYGAYTHTPKLAEYGYAKRLEDDYTFGWPTIHETIGNEHKTCRDKGVVFDQSAFGKFILKGRDAGKALEWLCTNSIQDKAIGSGVYTNMCNPDGGVECDLTVHHIEDDPADGQPGYYIVTGGLTATHDAHWIKHVIKEKGFNCELIDQTEEHGVMGVMGRISKDLLQGVATGDSKNLFSDLKNFPFSGNRVVELAGHKVRALRITYVGELGWELHIPKASCLPLYDTLMEKGAPLGLINAGYRALDCLAVEKGYRHWHADLRSTDTPIEAGLGFICKLKSNTPFLGREVLEKQKEQGVTKRIVCLSMGKEHGPLYGTEGIYRNGENVGFVRRAAFGHHVGRSIAYGYITKQKGKGIVDTDYVTSGQYEIESYGNKHPATLHTKAVVDPENNRIKGNYQLV